MLLVDRHDNLLNTHITHATYSYIELSIDSTNGRLSVFIRVETYPYTPVRSASVKHSKENDVARVCILAGAIHANGSTKIHIHGPTMFEGNTADLDGGVR